MDRIPLARRLGRLAPVFALGAVVGVVVGVAATLLTLLILAST